MNDKVRYTIYFDKESDVWAYKVKCDRFDKPYYDVLEDLVYIPLFPESDINLDRLMVIYKLNMENNLHLTYKSKDSEIFDLIGLDYERYLCLNLINDTYKQIRDEVFEDIDTFWFFAIFN